jgi:nucleoside-diphosphate-sugar epimerase
MTAPSPIIVYGGAGRIGRILCEALGAKSVERGEPAIEADTVIWCAATGDSETHGRLEDQAFLTASFLDMMMSQQQARRIIFTSSFGAVSPINYYAAHKLACEAMLEAWAKMPGRAAVSIRMGGYGRETPPGAWYEMALSQILAVYLEALDAPIGFRILHPLAGRERS